MKDLKELSKPLTASQLEFRVANVFKGKEKIFAQLLAYKSQRVDQEILDDVVGHGNWQIKFRQEADCVVASLGIKTIDPHPEWVWKEGNGTPGDFEAAKGAYSDAQKRAGFQWGIGRGLYDFPQIFVELFVGEYTEKDGKVYAGKSLRPQDWKWSVEYNKDNSVKELKAEHKGNIRFNYKLK